MLAGRYKTGTVFAPGNGAQEKSTATLSKAALVDAIKDVGYGVRIKNNVNNIVITRKANSSNFPLIRGGNYTVKAYGMTAF